MHVSEHDSVDFIHHGDFSGEITIRGWDNREVTVTKKALVGIVAQMVRGEKIEALEQASDEKVLGLKSKTPAP